MTQPPCYCHWQLADVAYVRRRAKKNKCALVDVEARKEQNVIPS